MKKLYSLLMIVVLLISPVKGFAAPSANMAVSLVTDSSSYAQNSTISVNINISDANKVAVNGLAAAKVVIIYNSSEFDTSAFTAVNGATGDTEFTDAGYTKGDKVANTSFFDFSRPVDINIGGGKRKITFLVYDATGGYNPVMDANFTLGTFKINLKSGASSNATLYIEKESLQLANGDAQVSEVPASRVTTVDTAFTVQGALPTKVSEVYISSEASSYTVALGSTLKFSSSVLPSNAIDKTVSWSVANGSGSASISQNGLLTPITVGSVNVTASSNGASDVSSTVPVIITDNSIKVSEIRISELTAVVGSPVDLVANVLPELASDKRVIWSVSDLTGSASIINSSGKLTGIREGTVTVRATALDSSGVFGETIVTILSVPKLVTSIVINSPTTQVAVGGTIQLSTTLLPVDASTKTVTWSVESGVAYATVDSLTGLVHAKKEGTLTIKATAMDGSLINATKIITVVASTSVIPSNPGTPGGPSGGTSIIQPTSTPKPMSSPTPTPIVDFKPIMNADSKEVIAKLVEGIKQSLAFPATSDTHFTDTEGHWASKEVNTAVSAGIANGYSDGSFKPNNSITRAEFAKLILNTFKIEKLSTTGRVLTDISGHWANEAIIALSSNGIINGYSDGTFKPNKEITRSEMIAIILRVIDVNSFAVPTSSAINFTDISGMWNKEQINASAQAGIIAGISEGVFAPNKNSTRAEALTVIIRTLRLIPELRGLL